MHVTVFGATGRLGREILWAAPDRGFTVTAHARRLMSDSEPGIEWATGDAGSTVKGADAVLVVFGPRTPSDVPFCATETEQILSAMELVHQSEVGCELVVSADTDPDPANGGFDHVLPTTSFEHVCFGVRLVSTAGYLPARVQNEDVEDIGPVALGVPRADINAESQTDRSQTTGRSCPQMVRQSSTPSCWPGSSHS